ncbi:molecular chaperone HtpG [Fontisphaera persica]|uniref:molecular chaperone HtpG n=1 Tax=Fontisphaera persica TaxID=2974023 RepID=UPI0024BFBEF8|nr:molecular chaperone HtpG [Fontisphaera persica]WCJ58643.1 molecular chaperone HtpG [Fontisphaera persica]
MKEQRDMSEKHQFQAEIQQLLDIVIHSLYTDREIFLRELISNAADACERLRFLQTSGEALHQADTPLAIRIQSDAAAGTLTITDTGDGMTQAELVENLGTIAHSGTRAFLQQLAREKQADTHLIGQFGVGFYSAFMVASKVVVRTRSWRPQESGWQWTSEGAQGYELEPVADLPRGTSIILHLKEDAKTFAQPEEIERLIKRYSNFIQYPIELNGKRINTIQAIWSRQKSEIKEQEYEDFYKFVAHDHEGPLMRLHFTADAPLAIQALLFVPKFNWEVLGLGRTEPGVHLYCKKVLIQSRPKELLPEWLRFLRGVVDSEDLPLHISRESMQDTALMKKLGKVLTGRFLKFLEEQAEKEPERYKEFYQTYHRFLKEGVVTDREHQAALGRLLRFESSAVKAGEHIALADYVKRMPPEQKEIYFLPAASRKAAEASPYYEVFKARQREVLFLYDPWEELVLDHLREFDGKPLVSAEKASLTLETPPPAEAALSEAEAKELAEWCQKTLGEEVEKVEVSQRLVDSPAAVVDPSRMVTSTMRRLLRAMHQEEALTPKLNLELNPRHPLVRRLNELRSQDTALAELVARQLLDNARIAAGLLEEPSAMVQRLNQLLERALGQK